MSFPWNKIGEKLNKIVGAEVAVISPDENVDFSTFNVSEEVKEAAKIALKTKVRVNISVNGEKVLVVPLILNDEQKALAFTSYDISEETFVNLILEIVRHDSESYKRKIKVTEPTDPMKSMKLHPDLLETLEFFFNNDSSIIKTAIAMNVHRNTVLYRLNKIKELTGLDPKNFKDALKLYSFLIKRRNPSLGGPN